MPNQIKTYKIILDDLKHPDVIALIAKHRENMLSITPEESLHALGVDELKKDNVNFWTAWEGDVLLGCGALKTFNEAEAEIKSMRTHTDHLKKGVANQILSHIIDYAKEIGLKTIYLETGSDAAFTPAHTLYKKYGFQMCGPFEGYVEDANSYFMFLKLG